LKQQSIRQWPPKFFANPWFGLIGSIASVLGVVLAIYFYTEGREKHELAYYVNPARAVVVQKGSASKLTVTFDNQPVTTDITAAQIAVWNEGKLPIRKDDILKSILLRTEGAPILEASVRKISRDVTQFSISDREIHNGQVLLSWNILEHNDGAIIQVIYAGGPFVKVWLDGVVEGQPALTNAIPPSRTTWWVIFVFTMLGFADLVLYYLTKSMPKILRFGVMAVLIPLVIIMIVLLVIASRGPSVPMSF
jgi:hypothetical protein